MSLLSSIFPDGKDGFAAELAYNELRTARVKFPKPFNSHHEGYAILEEEMDELWDAIKKNDYQHAREEAIQVAAMALRFISDLSNKEAEPC